ARMERYLQMCAELNMVITNITTAANLFHALRRQLAWSFRKPLINFSPKANLRHPGSYSLMSDFTSGGFKEVIDDQEAKAKKVNRVLFCSGKVYFDLHEYKTKNNIEDTAVVRVEQLHPLPLKQLQTLVAKYGKAEWTWVQEEPMNMGAASFLRMNLDSFSFKIVARSASAATATGFSKIHAAEQDSIIKRAFTS
ncbi:MAG: 2-oxoglutarate dehydrogenase E1 component, partial [bacterium]